jgi:methylated-DNA-[protein]-cysteine S-methyltransferase
MPEVVLATAIGDCRLSWGDGGLTRFRLPEDGGGKGSRTPSARTLESAPDWVQGAARRVVSHLGGDPQDFGGETLDWSQVSEFQQAVYRNALTIRSGSKKSYGAIAKDLGLGPEGARAVGAALGANPWPLIVPCHRVVSSDDRMTGFSAPGGVRTKTRLLVLVGAELLSE